MCTMQTPIHNIGRRTTRHALAEIPTRLGLLAVTNGEEGRRMFSSNFQNTEANIGLVTPNSISDVFLTPSPSPEELVIQQRGRRKLPVTFSPDIDELKKDLHNRDRKDHTPIKQIPGSPGRSSIVLRSTPRKRLLLTDPLESITSDASKKVMSPSPKKIKIDNVVDTSETSLLDVLKVCTANQLITIIGQFIQKFPGTETDFKMLIPKPDFHSIDDNFVYLKRNIYKSLPRCRLVSKTDASAYNRASTHVLAFKKFLIEQGQQFLESKQWNTIMEYFILAWKAVRSTPIWDNPSHNIPRKQCFRTLGTYCMAAIKSGQFTQEQVKHYRTVITTFLEDNDDLQPCLKQMDKMYKK